MTKALELNISGIKCDNPDCDYRDEEVSRENYPEYVNKECPSCGSILLTEADYETVVVMEEAVAYLNVNIPEDLLDPGAAEATLDIVMNGSGDMELEEQE